MMLRARMLLLFVILILSTMGCRSAEPTVTVSAAANLERALSDIGAQFEKQTGTRVSFNFGSTGQLAQQIAQGAPVDLFASADRSTVEDLAERGYILQDTVQVYGRGRIVLYTRADAPISIQRLDDLSRFEIQRIAIANPERAPYGRAAQEALERAGLWKLIEPKLILTENIQQTLQYADSGNVDAAITAFSLALESKGRWVMIPSDLYAPLDQALGVIQGAHNEAAARQLAAFILGEQGRAVLTKYGYALPGE